MMVKCAWCGADLGLKEGSGVSHGLCEGCSVLIIDGLGSIVKARAAESLRVVGVGCPRCAVPAGEPCGKVGKLDAFVDLPSYHIERWEGAFKALKAPRTE